MKVTVTQKMIDRGKAADHQNCPIALALRQWRPWRRVSVGVQFVRIGSRGYKQPNDMFLWRQRFDAGLPVKPATFDL